MYIKQLTVEPTHDGYRGQAEITTGAYSLTVDIAQSDNVENCRFRVWGRELGRITTVFSADLARDNWEGHEDFYAHFGIDVFRLYANLKWLMNEYMSAEREINNEY